MKLHPDKQLEISHENLTHILSLYNILDFTFKLFDGGIENTSVYIKTDQQEYVLRIYCQNKKTDNDILLEIEFQKYLRANGIPIPFLYRTNENQELGIVTIDNKRWQVVLMEFKEGKSIEAHPTPELLTQLAHIQAKMHLLGIKFAEFTNHPKESITTITGSIAERISKSPLQTEEVLGFIERAKSYAYYLDTTLPHGYNHLDLDFAGNVLTKDDEITAIIDFDDLKYSPIIMCLGFTLWNILNDKGPQACKLYLNEYEKIRPLRQTERQELPNIIFFRNYEVGIIRLLLWEENTPMEDITRILELEKEIPNLNLSDILSS